MGEDFQEELNQQLLVVISARGHKGSGHRHCLIVMDAIKTAKTENQQILATFVYNYLRWILE